MNKTKLTIILIIIFAKSYSQDTIYSFNYPNGIITKSLTATKNHYRLNPINNTTLVITISKESTRKINYQNGDKFVNPNPIDYTDEEVVLLTDPLTGKINFNEVIEIKGAKKKDLFNSVKSIPQGITKYFLIASDETEFSFLKYVCRFPVSYAGDQYVLYFNLLVKFKDGKVKYEYSDFVATFAETKSKQSANILDAFSNGVNTSTKEHTIVLDIFYAKPTKSDKKKFWTPIFANINESIYSLKKVCTDASSESKDGW